ncbi:M48 family metalloprotease [Thermosynechococcus sp. JY1334]|uniref:M48 family metalloprotease n=1 Tax=unclassified Thermosynechococcus TaxID=2622553 RepID=UPI002672934B|nr:MULTISPECIES: M48 family metalloprotease [unclassified Thermosynechococcus]MDR7896848.1 M48 family metalloprotease [Thermosynechococcus sp. JY1332]MDR7904245.1 M48 family metalloprotease [Thermosynechococcus sp. JY1334]WKT86497.1 M48 family metalloprotease [Thermosynechococcus sp. JY1339]WNC55442.1 M48 family metalloprotease [Thermosynechococcus sp. JY1331]
MVQDGLRYWPLGIVLLLGVALEPVRAAEMSLPQTGVAEEELIALIKEDPFAQARLPQSEGSAVDLLPLPPQPPPAVVPPVESPAPLPTSTEIKDDSAAPSVEPAPRTTDNSSGAPTTVELTAEQAAQEARLALLREGDRHWQLGDTVTAQTYYQKAKADLDLPPPRVTPPAVLEISQLPPAAQVYWREVQGGSQLYSAQAVPLRLLVEQFPEFIPGQVRFAEFLAQQGSLKEAYAHLEKAASLYPDQPDIQRSLVTLYDRQQQWLEAALAAQRFALLNPDHPATPEFQQLAAERMQRFRRRLQGQLREGMIVGALTGLVGVALTGNPLLSLDSIQMMALMMQGESPLGRSAAQQISRQVKLLEDPEVQAYVNEVGQRLAKVAGRNEFEYEFFVIKDNDLNAFALPGGKIFINSGAILKANTEAELAGLLAHEIAHAVLSHGFRLVTQGTATANLTRLLPAGGYVTGILVTSYSREMEREADILGTRILAKAGYAADGLLNLMHTLKKEYRHQEPPLPWFSTHPPTNERIRYIRGLMRDRGYTPFAFEGVERHQQIQARLRTLVDPPNPKKSKRETAKTPQ